MFSYRAVLRDPESGSTYRLEHAEEDQWRLFCDDEEVELADMSRPNPNFYRDGGSTETLLATREMLIIPQQMFRDGRKPPSLGGRQLELVEWWLGGKQYV